jgi:hypothetical protein
MIKGGRIRKRWTIILVPALCLAGWYWYESRTAKPNPVHTDALKPVEHDVIDFSSVRCGKTLHLHGTVSSQVNPESYAIVDHTDGDVTHITNIRKALNTALPVAGDVVDVWGIVECEGPRYHLNEIRRVNSSR